jgi:demethylmenaquinone methyltransferase/2-methoxy-6-polyprenyl-1,4-benzoquinol methylase
MLRRGAGKLAGAPVSPVVADALQLPLPDECAQGALVAFGVRNLADLDAGLREARRILAPGSRFVVLEFSTPANPVVRFGYGAYFRYLLPAVGRAVSGHPTAYRYLPESVSHFPTGDALAARLEAAGFQSVTWRPLTFGIAALHVAVA